MAATRQTLRSIGAHTDAAMNPLPSPSKHDATSLAPSTPVAARSPIGISELDSRIQDEIAEYGSVKDFKVMLWRQAPDPTGSNWDARICRIRGDGATDWRWWVVVPQLRERFNLS
jgi:hypothetical protein